MITRAWINHKQHYMANVKPLAWIACPLHARALVVPPNTTNVKCGTQLDDKKE